MASCKVGTNQIMAVLLKACVMCCADAEHWGEEPPVFCELVLLVTAPVFSGLYRSFCVISPLGNFMFHVCSVFTQVSVVVLKKKNCSKMQKTNCTVCYIYIYFESSSFNGCDHIGRSRSLRLFISSNQALPLLILLTEKEVLEVKNKTKLSTPGFWLWGM